MNYYRLNIDTDGTEKNYNEISKVLGVQPTSFPAGRFNKNPFDIWTYCVDETDDGPYYDFINEFLDILEPNFSDLEKLGVTRDKIIFWRIYEYDQQCCMEYHPKEMKRLGESGIVMCIDCYQTGEQTNTNS
jgi:hypothetical protein